MIVKTAIVVLAVLVLLACPSPLVSNAQGVTFDIGDRQPGMESDTVSSGGQKFYFFDSNCSIKTRPGFINQVSAMFDGNESTGVDFNSGGAFTSIAVYVMFPYPLYVDNLTVDDTFNGSASICTITLVVRGHDLHANIAISGRQTVEVNNFLTGIYVGLVSTGGNQFNMGDVLFDYTPVPNTIEGVQQAIQLLFHKFNQLEKQFDNLTLLVENLYELVEGINGTVNNINITQQEILGDIVNIWSAYDVLNQTIIELTEQYMYLNNSFIEETIIIQNDLDDIWSNISIIESAVTNLGDDLTVIQELRDALNSTLEDITVLEDRVTVLESAVPDIYDDTALKERIAELEAENGVLKGDIGNLTGELEAVEPQFRLLNDEIANLTSRLQDLEQAPPVEDPNDEKEGGADEDTDLSLLVLIAFILGLVGILLGTAAMYKAHKSPAKGHKEGDTADSVELPAPPPAPEPPLGEAPSAPVEENAGVNTYQITNSSGPTSGGGQPASAQPAVLAGESPAPAAIPPAPLPV